MASPSSTSIDLMFFCFPSFCIGSEGGVYEGRGWDYKGAHAGRADNYSIGICMIGDWESMFKNAPIFEMYRQSGSLY